ncbi:MAG: TIGR00341 family protein [Pyrinomonadaceae bacterium]
MNNIFNNFRLDGEKEDFVKVIEGVDRDVVFKGTNLWILVFAIFIASLGLNVNSPAVVIGAMLVSPLMGPIIGLGIGMAINDLDLLKKAAYNYLAAAGIGLATSTIFFSLSPLTEASSEILSRTSPNIYDVLIALFGGFAGILAVASRNKGNVIPGVAIATALMPPLCTAGFGLANWNLSFLSGALYLFVINTVFIALATLLTARFLRFPSKHLPDERDEVVANRIVWGVVIITILPSIYFGYDIVKQNQFQKRANQFVDLEAIFPNDYLLKKSIDAKNKTITLTYGGEVIHEDEIEKLRSKLDQYELPETKLEIRQGFAYLKDDKEGEDQTKQLSNVLKEKEREIQSLSEQVKAYEAQKTFSKQIFNELRAQYPKIRSYILQQSVANIESEQRPAWVSVVSSEEFISPEERQKIEAWLKVRINSEKIQVFYRAPMKKEEIEETAEPKAN